MAACFSFADYVDNNYPKRRKRRAAIWGERRNKIGKETGMCVCVRRGGGWIYGETHVHERRDVIMDDRTTQNRINMGHRGEWVGRKGISAFSFQFFQDREQRERASPGAFGDPAPLMLLCVCARLVSSLETKEKDAPARSSYKPLRARPHPPAHQSCRS